MNIDDELVKSILCGNSDAGTVADPAKVNVPPLSLARLAEVAELMNKMPPPPDRHHCAKCSEEMSKPAMIITSGTHVFAPVLGYLCGRCAVMAKREFYYKPRQREGR